MADNPVQFERIRALLFDAGETLVGSDFHVPSLIVQFASELDLKLELPRIEQAFEEANRRYNLIYSQLIFHREFEKLEEHWHDFGCYVLSSAGVPNPERYSLPLHRRIDDYLFGEQTSVWRVFDDVLPVLQEARLRGLTLGIVSNWDHSLHRVLEITQLTRWFDFVVASMETGFEKPNKKIFKKALKLAGIPAKEAIHIGDSYEADVLGAQALGISPMLIDRANAYPDAECIRLTDLRQIWDYL